MRAEFVIQVIEKLDTCFCSILKLLMIIYQRKSNFDLKISFWEYSFIMNKHNQKPTDMFNKQDVTVYLTYIKLLKDLIY